MDDKYRQLIEDMAAKFGTTAEHLWGVLVKQAPISGAVNLALCIVIATAAIWWLKIVIRKTKPVSPGPNKHPGAEWEYDTAVPAYISAAVAVILAIAFILMSANGIVTSFLNPEYWALLQLLKR